MSRAFRDSALTLSEVMLALGLFSLLTLTAAGLLHWITRSLGWMQARSTMQQQGLIIMDRCESDLRQSSIAGLSLGSGQLYAMNRLQNDIYPGMSAFEMSEVVYRRNGTSLFREIYSQPRPDWRSDRPNTLTPGQLTALLQTLPSQRICLTQSASSFTIQITQAPTVQVDLQLESWVAGRGQPVRFQVRRLFYLRNKY